MDSWFDPRNVIGKVAMVKGHGTRGLNEQWGRELEILAKEPRPRGRERLTSHQMRKGQGCAAKCLVFMWCISTGMNVKDHFQVWIKLSPASAVPAIQVQNVQVTCGHSSLLFPKPGQSPCLDDCTSSFFYEQYPFLFIAITIGMGVNYWSLLSKGLGFDIAFF